MKKVLDIFSWMPAEKLSLENIEQAFMNADSNTKSSALEICFDRQVSSEDMQGAMNELLSENKEVAVVKMNGEPVAMIGFVYA